MMESGTEAVAPTYVATAPAPAASYIQPATYAPPVYVQESYAASSQAVVPAPYQGAAPSYSPAPAATSSYIPATVAYPQSPMRVTTSGSYTPEPLVASVPAMGTYSPMVMQAPLSPMAASQQTGSYVAAPGAPPPKLTEGMPDPSSVESQKQSYSKAIET